MAASTFPCPSCHTLLKFTTAPQPGKSFRCPKCQTVVQAPASDPEVVESAAPAAARAAATKPAAGRKPAAQSDNAFSFVEQERIEEATAPPPRKKGGGGLLAVTILSVLFLLGGAGGGGYAVLYYTGALTPKPAPPPVEPPKLVGRWELKDVKPTQFTEFRADGTLVNGGNGIEMKGTWKLVDDATVEVSLNVAGKEPLKRQLKFQVTKDELTLTDGQNPSEVFLRAAAAP